MASPAVINKYEDVINSEDYKKILADNIKEPKYLSLVRDNQLNEEDGKRIYGIVSLLDYYKDNNKLSLDIKLVILTHVHSYLVDLLKTLSPTPITPPAVIPRGQGDLSPGIITPGVPAPPHLHDILIDSLNAVEQEISSVLSSQPIIKSIPLIGVANPINIIKFTGGLCAGEGCFFTHEYFIDSLSNYLNYVEEVVLNKIGDLDERIDINTFLNLPILKDKQYGYKVFAKKNLNTKKIISDLKEALGNDFNDKTTYVIDDTKQAYGFTIKFNEPFTAVLEDRDNNSKYEDLKEIEVLFQYGCQQDLLNYSRNPKGKINNTQVKEQFESLLDTLITLHDSGIVHLDIKLQNIMKCDSTFRFIDFAIGKINENTENFITTYHISTKPTLNFTKYIIEEWIKNPENRKNLKDLALIIFKLTDIFCLINAYLQLTNSQNNFIKTTSDSQHSYIDMIAMYNYIESYSIKYPDNNFLKNSIDYINKLITQYKKKDIKNLGLDETQLEDINLLQQNGGKSKKRSQSGGTNNTIVTEVNRIFKANNIPTTITESDIKSYLDAIPENYRGKNTDIVSKFVAFRYLCNNYIPNQSMEEVNFGNKVKEVELMNNLISDVTKGIKEQFENSILEEREIAKQQNAGSSKMNKFFNKYKNTFFVSSVKPNPMDTVIYVYRLDTPNQVSRFKIDLQKNPTISLKNLKSKKFIVTLSKDNKRLKLDNNYLVPL